MCPGVTAVLPERGSRVRRCQGTRLLPGKALPGVLSPRGGGTEPYGRGSSQPHGHVCWAPPDGELIRKLPLSVLAAIKNPAPRSDSAGRVGAPKMPFPGGGRTRRSTGLGWSRATACPRASPARHRGTALPFGLKGNCYGVWKAGKQIIQMTDDTAGAGGGANND